MPGGMWLRLMARLVLSMESTYSLLHLHSQQYGFARPVSRLIWGIFRYGVKFGLLWPDLLRGE